MQFLAEMRDLESLILQGTAVDDEGAPSLVTLKRLNTLNLGRTRITSQAVAALAELKGLHWLGLSETAVDDSAIPSLASMRELSTLSIEGTRISGRGLHTLLRALTVEWMTADLADLRGFKFPSDLQRNSAMKRLTDLDGIGRLKLIDCARSNITDDQVRLLRGLKHVELIDLRQTTVSDQAQKNCDRRCRNAKS